MINSLQILKNIETAFSLTPIQKIKLSCAIQLLESKKPRQIKRYFSDMLLNPDLTPEEKNAIECFYHKNYLYRLKNRLLTYPVSIFKKGDFLKLFLKRYPSPQYVRLPFIDWDIDILRHYLSLAYNYITSERRIKDALSSYSPNEELPFLTFSGDILLRPQINTFLFIDYLIKAPVQSKSKDFTHFIPLRFDCKTSKSNKLKAYRYADSKKDIFELAENMAPSQRINALFFCLETQNRVIHFKNCFLRRKTLPNSTFIFLKLLHLKKLSKSHNTTYIKPFYEWVSPVIKAFNDISKCQDTTSIIESYKSIIKKYEKNSPCAK
ncbi:hypothetical protein [Sellimonas intestinalis]|uniref:hypothetical protein n=1 Tax=Sellimonas intestinalis TaxID=1653434 RepID=UPI003AB410AD